jgi:predicted MFS family arabinose efflux permease
VKEAVSIAVESIVREKARHVTNAVATGTAATAGATGSLIGEMLGWLPHVAVVAGLCVSCALFYKTYLEIRLTKVKLAKEGRREADK